MRCWEYRHRTPSPIVHRGPLVPTRLTVSGYKAKQGYVIHRIYVRRGDRKKQIQA